MKPIKKRFALSALSVAGAVGLAAFAPVTSQANGQGLKVGVQDACADGSCAPFTDYICGLNGSNYPDKVFVPAGS